MGGTGRRVTAKLASSAQDSASARLVALCEADGHRSAPHYRALLAHADASELADLAHFLCLLHGLRPGVIDHAAPRIAERAAGAWLDRATDAFTLERSYITRLTVAAGPVSGASEHDHSEAAAVELRGSFQLIASSERRGCAAGAALAFALDWPALRSILDPMAQRLGLEAPPCDLPSRAETLGMADIVAAEPASARAFFFGADQLYQLQRGVWRLLAARARLRTERG